MAERTLFRFVPPAGHSIGPHHVVKALFDSFLESGRGFTGMLRAYLGTEFCFPVSSGTAALYLILKTIAERTDRDEVIIPAYCCPSLVAAAAKAGLNVRLCDIERDGFGLDLRMLGQLLNDRTLCVVVVHLFGVPIDVGPIRSLSAQQGVIVVEDSAQAFGIETDDAKLGMKGDIGFYSFGRGKPLSMLGGAAIVTSRIDLAQYIERTLAELPRGGFMTSVSSFAKVATYSLFVHPHFYWIPNSLPFLELGKTRFISGFEVHSLCRYHAALGKILLSLNDSMNEARRTHSLFLIERMAEIADSSTFFIPHVDFPIPYLRLPVIFSSSDLRKRVGKELIRKGIGATPMYGTALPKITGVPEHLLGVQEYPNAEYIAVRLLTLPVSSLMTQKDLNAVIEVFEEAYTPRKYL